MTRSDDDRGDFPEDQDASLAAQRVALAPERLGDRLGILRWIRELGFVCRLPVQRRLGRRAAPVADLAAFYELTDQARDLGAGEAVTFSR